MFGGELPGFSEVLELGEKLESWVGFELTIQGLSDLVGTSPDDSEGVGVNG